MAGNGVNLFSRSDVERIVREVLAELLKNHPPAVAETELVVTSKVVSLRDVEKKLNGITRLVVVRGAVITPAARDELKKHNVTIASAVASR